MTPPFPDKSRLKICFAHRAFDLKPLFDTACPGIETRQVKTQNALRSALLDSHVLVVSGLWKNELLKWTRELRYLQSISVGMNQYDAPAFEARGIRLASGRGVNTNAVSEHAMGLLLSLTRRLGQARDDQARKRWQKDVPPLGQRSDELPGKTMLIIGTGSIGDRIARLARAFEMRVVGLRHDPAKGPGETDEIHGFGALHRLIPAADVVMVSCPLTAETTGLVDAQALRLAKPGALLINIGRGACVDEAALIAALRSGHLGGAGLDVAETEPVPRTSPLWSLPNVVLTPHVAGETRRYEENVVALLRQNLDRLWAGETTLINQIV